MEYRLPGVSQIDVKPEIGLTFANGLRAILRQDPNIVMVGEIRDFETAEIAIRAAMTGHLVFSTLHTNDAVSGITRLLDMGIEPFLLASVVRAFIAQRLVRTICPDCKEDDRLPDRLPAGDRRADAGGHEVLPRRGCDHCRQTGYRGRAAIYEICVGQRESAAPDHPQGNRQRAESPRHSRRHGHAARRRLAARSRGQTTVEEVVRVTQADEAMTETD